MGLREHLLDDLAVPGRQERDRLAQVLQLAPLDGVLFGGRVPARVGLRGIERRERQVIDLTLEDVYVSLAATLTPERKEKLRTSRDEIALLLYDKLFLLHPHQLLCLLPIFRKNLFLPFRNSKFENPLTCKLLLLQIE